VNASQKKVFDYVRKNPAVTAVEVARALGKTSANARYHLMRLVEDGNVEIVGDRNGLGRGRPEQLYRLSRTAEGNNLGLLSAALLTEWKGAPVKYKFPNLMEKLALQMAGEISLDWKTHITRRLADAVVRLNRLHYHSRWEATVSGPRLILGNCPYGEIIGSHPELCKMDAHLMQLLLGASVEQTAKLEQSLRGGIFCAFLILDNLNR